ncbi:hypothetical protein [Nostoc sp. NZL]|uniref:hypothetical protein n=1 Tax=Nostoc sp. NZL TaxID=2650612 RepID=UPI0018C55FEC|nr:hypothetical protein [Nostoc sp. NZL]
MRRSKVRSLDLQFCGKGAIALYPFILRESPQARYRNVPPFFKEGSGDALMRKGE